MQTLNCAYVLAGGQSRRMGRDKLFVNFGDKPVLEKTLEVCNRRFPKVAIVAKDAAKFAALNHGVVLDADGVSGPLAGVIAALRHCNDDACFITAADLVDLSVEMIDQLCAVYTNEDYLGIREDSDIQPLCGIYAVSALQHLERSAQLSKNRVRDVLEDLNTRCIDAPAVWRNLNYPADLVVDRI